MARPAISQERVQAVIAGLAPLPSSVRYYDDFLDVWHSIRRPGEMDEWTIQTDGRTTTFNFTIFGRHARLMQHLLVWELETVDPTTVVIFHSSISSLLDQKRAELLDAMLALKPWEFRQLWIKEVASMSSFQASALKGLLYAICDIHIGSWTNDHRDYIAKLPSPKVDRYRVVRTGKCFVPLDQQSLVIDYFDEISHLAETDLAAVTTEELRNACILIIVYQHAFRPGQLARIKTSDVRVFNTGARAGPGNSDRAISGFPA